MVIYGILTMRTPKSHRLEQEMEHCQSPRYGEYHPDLCDNYFLAFPYSSANSLSTPNKSFVLLVFELYK